MLCAPVLLSESTIYYLVSARASARITLQCSFSSFVGSARTFTLATLASLWTRFTLFKWPFLFVYSPGWAWDTEGTKEREREREREKEREKKKERETK